MASTPSASARALDVVEGDVALAPLHGADVGAVDPRALSERLLREAAIGAEPAHACTECASSLEGQD